MFRNLLVFLPVFLVKFGIKIRFWKRRLDVGAIFIS